MQGMVVYGAHPVEEFLEVAPERARQLWVQAGREERLDALIQRAQALGLRVRVTGRDRLDTLAGAGVNHQGVVLEGDAFPYKGLEEVLGTCEGQAHACILVLDQVQDAGNLGAILRSAAAFGVTAVMIPKDRAAQVTGAVIRASAGQAWRVPVVQVTNLTRALEELQAAGFWAVATKVTPGEEVAPLWSIDLKMRVALVLGAEQRGVRRLVAERSDFLAQIPMAPGVESLNVAACAAIALYEIARQWAS